ncbi:amino acid ABC transporter permease [Pseudomonas silvicola]|nr:amino acid ABC transporter permease [Pseudomonas silvicola]
MFDLFKIVHDNWPLFLIGQYPHGPLGGLASTLILAASALVLAFPLGLLLALARVSPWRWLRYPATVWVYVLRGIPLLMVIFWTYFLVPLLIGHNITGFTTMLCTLVVYQSAYLGEIIRGGIQALPGGQYEGARALGLGYVRSLRYVVLPQGVRNCLPSLINHSVLLFKNTSLAMAIGVVELTYATREVENYTFRTFESYLVATVVYLAFSLMLMGAGALVARHFSKALAR